MHSILAVILLAIEIVDGSHFLGGTITWHPLNASATGSPVDIVITQTYSWSYSIAACTSSMIATNQLVPLTGWQSVSTHRLACSWNCATGTGGYTSRPVASYCTDFSAPAGTTVGQRSDIVRLNATANFSASYENNYWRNLTSVTDAPWAISTYINLAPRPDNGLYNNAPVATVMSPIYIVKGQPTIIHIPVADADGDTLRCRWAKSANGNDECGGICPPGSLPNGTVIFPNCTMIITGPDVGNWFAAAIMVEDFINSSSTTALSSAPVQFLIQVIAPPACSVTPEIVGVPQEGSCMAITVGQNITTDLFAINSCGPSVNITDISTLSFPGVLKGNLIEWNSTTYSKSITWTPTSSQLGYQLMCAMALNSQNAQSGQFCFTFYVSSVSGATCPGFSTTTSTSTSTTTDASNTTTSVTIASPSTTTPAKATETSWPLIGAISGLFFLASLAFLSFLCWRFCCGSCRNSKIGYSAIKPVLYHIDRCQDPFCQANVYLRSTIMRNPSCFTADEIGSIIEMNESSQSSWQTSSISKFSNDKQTSVLSASTLRKTHHHRLTLNPSIRVNRVRPIHITSGTSSERSSQELLHQSIESNARDDYHSQNTKREKSNINSVNSALTNVRINRILSVTSIPTGKMTKSHSRSRSGVCVKHVSKSRISLTDV